MRKYYIIGTGADFIKIMWNDCLQQDNFHYMDELKKNYSKNRIVNYLKKIQFSYKMFNITKHCGKIIWRSEYSLFYEKLDKRHENIIIISDTMRMLLDVNFLNKIRRKYNAKIVLTMLNSCKAIFKKDDEYIRRILKKLPVDLIFSFDRQDCINFDLNYFPSIYSKTEINEKIKYDAFYVGKIKNRYELIMDVAHRISEESNNNLFRIIDVPDELKIINKQIIYNEIIPYNEVLKNVAASKCIVDIAVKEQTGLSLKFFEAICYNKKLLTNNKSVMNTPYYNKKYIQVFENSEDIDIDFINNEEVVDYNYQNDYSPVEFIKQLDLYLENNSKRNK